MNFRNLSLILLICSLFSLIGCSGTSGSTTPPAENPALIEGLPVDVSAISSDGSPLEGMGALGLFSLHIDPMDITADLTSLRKSALTDVLEVVDITNFLSLAPCTDCAKIKSIALDADNHIVVSIGIRHPFNAGDPLKPISGRNRGDLHVFNVEGIVVSNARGAEFPGIGQTSADFILANADGYTGYLDDSLDAIYPTDATVHPYILHFDDYSQGNFDASNPMGFESVTNPPPMGNLVMAMGCDYDYKDYVFNLDAPLDFIFAVGCTYALSAATMTERFEPVYRVPQHNKKAASEVWVEWVSGGLISGNTSSTAEINVCVVDISQGVSVGDDLNQMLAESNVDDILIEIPGVMLAVRVIDGSNPSSGTGHDPSDPLRYNTTIQNWMGAQEGTYTGLIKVMDTYSPGLNTNIFLSGNDGARRVDPLDNPFTSLFEINKFATYQVFQVHVGSGCGPITGSVLNPTCPVTGVASGQKLNFTVEAQSDNGGGSIVLYEVDYDYDGTTFTADSSNTDGIFNDVGPFTVPDPCEDNIPQTYTVAFRATDECVPPNNTIFATCDVTVDSCLTPVGNVNLKVNYIVAEIIPPATTPHGWQFDYNGPFTLTWDPVPGAAEYAVYYDNDPSDGLKTLPLLPVGTTASSIYTVPASHLVSNHYIPGNTYYVCSRAIVGGANAPESEPAFVTISGYETGAYFDPSCEGWYTHCEANTTDFRYAPYVDGWGLIHIHGANNVFFSNQFFGPGNNNRWHGWAKETPIVENSSVRYLSFSARSYYIWPDHGMFIGTIAGSSLPSINWTTPSDMQWAQVDSTGGFHGYDYNSADVRNTFTDVPDGNNSWYTQYSPPYDLDWYNFMIGGDVNIGGATSNASDPFVAIELVKLLYDYRAPQTVIDETGIAIY
jgi:hypothetical protein